MIAKSRPASFWLALILLSLVIGTFGRAGSGTTAAATSGRSATRAHAPTAQRTRATASPITLVYFNARGSEPVEQALIKRYMSEHPTIHIKYLSTTSLSGPSDTDAIANLIFNIQAHTVIDVAKVETSRTPLDLVDAHANTNLTTIDARAVKSRVKELLNTDYTAFANGVWGLPYEYDPFGYIYNATLFKQAGLDPNKPPRTWDQLRAVNKTIKAKFPNTWAICHPIDNLAKTMAYVWGAGGDYWDRPVLPTRAAFLNPAVIATYTFIQEWARNGWMNTAEIAGTDTPVRWMVSRRCAAMDLSADLALGLQLNDPSTDWRVAPTPTRTTRNKPINFAGGSTLVIPSTAKHPKEALAFLLWLTSQQGQRLKYGLDNSLGLSKQDLYTGAVPANRAVAQVLRKDPNWKQALATVDVPTQPDGPSPVFSKAYQVLADMQARIILKNANVMTELKAAQRQVQKLLDQGIKANPELYKR